MTSTDSIYTAEQITELRDRTIAAGVAVRNKYSNKGHAKYAAEFNRYKVAANLDQRTAHADIVCAVEDILGCPGQSAAVAEAGGSPYPSLAVVRARTARRTSAPTEAPAGSETLVCGSCAQPFTRTIVRGRKPTLGPCCKA